MFNTLIIDNHLVLPH